MYQFENGIPKFLVGQLFLDVSCKTKAKLVEITAANLALSLGMAETLVTSWNGTDEYDAWWQTDLADQELLTWKKVLWSSFEMIVLDHKNLKTATDVPVFSDTTGTAYTKDTDYFYDALNGIVYRLPTAAENAAYSGTIVSESQVRCKYKCTPAKSEELAFKRNGFTLWTGAVMLTGTDSTTGKETILYHPKAEISSGGLVTAAKSAWGLDLEIEAVDYPSTPTYPLGYIKKGI